MTQSLLSLLHRRCKKKRKKKNTWKKIYFCTKVILSLACVLCSFPFLLRAVVYVVEKLIQRGNFQIENFKLRRIVGFGTSVTVSPLLCHFQPVAARWECLLSLYFCRFLRRWNFVICSLWVVLWCSIFHGQKKRLLKKTQSELDWFCGTSHSKHDSLHET